MEQSLLEIAPHERLRALAREGRIIRNSWGGKTPDGRETACLYAALVPGAKETSGCPAGLMPQWIANMVPDIDDNGSDAAWPAMVERFGNVLPWRLDAAAERIVLAKTMIAVLSIAAPHDQHVVVHKVIALYEQTWTRASG
jgi:hypothetical protein